MPVSRRVWAILRRCLALRCPNCGGGKLFYGYFRMYPGCRPCGLRYERESGYFLGSIYINYGLTSLLVTATFFVFFLGFGVSPDMLLWPLAAFCFLFPMWFHRYARSLWLGFDVYFDPFQRRA